MRRSPTGSGQTAPDPADYRGETGTPVPQFTKCGVPMDTLDEKRVRMFFKSVISEFPVGQPVTSIVVTHLLPDRPFFLEALNQIAPIRSVLWKPKSASPDVFNYLQHKYQFDELSRHKLSDPEALRKYLACRAGGRKLVILDIGGYFASRVDLVACYVEGRLLGIVEDTENGVKRYENVDRLPVPIVSVARSPLKAPEDFLVGQSVVFSTEALLREQGDILHGRTACVIGYGKLGHSIARLLHARHVRTVVYDVDPIKAVQAMSHGFLVATSLEKALLGAGIVFCATGNLSLTSRDFCLLNDGAYVATVTSSDDELQLADLKDKYEVTHVADYVTRYRSNDHVFFLLNRGQAVNFIHGAAVGPFIYLVQAEIIASLSRITNEVLPATIHTNSLEVQQRIASNWYAIFGPRTQRRENQSYAR